MQTRSLAGLILVISTMPGLLARGQERVMSAPSASAFSNIETIAGVEGDDVPGKEFSFGGLAGLAADSFGNTYFTLQPLNRVYRLGADGRVSVYAGSGVRGAARDGVAATASPLMNPASLAVDSAGDLFIAVAGALLRVDASNGILSTLFKTPYRPAGSANEIRDLGRMAFGPGGLLYICGGFRVQTYSLTSGAVNVIAGNGTVGETRTDVPASSSPLRYPQSVAVARDGTVYFTTLEPAVFRVGAHSDKIESMNLQLGEGSQTLGEYDVPHSIALDDTGHLFVAQGNRSQILSVGVKSGTVSVYAGTGTQGFNGDEIKATEANVTIPTYVAADEDGNVIIGEEYRIRRVDATSGLITTIAGNGLPVSDVESTSARNAKLWEPANAVPGPDGSIYITSSFSQRLQRVSKDGILASVAGGGDPVRGEEPGPALGVSLNYPQGIWVGENGDVYFSDYSNRIIRLYSGKSGMVSNFALTPKNSNSAGVFLYHAGALVADENFFYLSDPDDNRVWRISRSDRKVEAYAGTGSEPGKHEGENALSTRLENPTGLALDGSGNLYIADGAMDGNQGRIVRVAENGRVKTILGNLRSPSGLAFRSAGELCFAESGANRVRCIDLESHDVVVVAGTGTAGFGGDGGSAECAELSRPSGISFDGVGNLYIADTGNQRVRMVRLGREGEGCGE